MSKAGPPARHLGVSCAREEASSGHVRHRPRVRPTARGSWRRRDWWRRTGSQRRGTDDQARPGLARADHRASFRGDGRGVLTPRQWLRDTQDAAAPRVDVGGTPGRHRSASPSAGARGSTYAGSGGRQPSPGNATPWGRRLPSEVAPRTSITRPPPMPLPTTPPGSRHGRTTTPSRCHRNPHQAAAPLGPQTTRCSPAVGSGAYALRAAALAWAGESSS